MISKVYLRKKKISKGKVSLYLDFYPPILIPGTNRTTRRYFLNVHLPEKPKSFAEREHVKSIMQKMEIFRLRVLEQIINEKFDFYDKIVEKTDFLDYFKNESLKHVIHTLPCHWPSVQILLLSRMYSDINRKVPQCDIPKS